MIRSLALAALALAAAGPETARTTGRSIGTLAEVPLRSRTGVPLRLGSRIAPGKPTLIAIWASWCPPCMVEAPLFARMRRDLGGGFNFVYVDRRDGDPDPKQPAAAVSQFLARADLADVDYVVADPRAYCRIVGADLRDLPDGKIGIPRVYVFDASGRQVHTAYGFAPGDADDLERRVKQAMVATR